MNIDDNELRTRIAKACPEIFEVVDFGGRPMVRWRNGPTNLSVDVLTDLNAIHRAEEILTGDQWDRYQIALANLVAGSPIGTYGHWSDVGSVFTAHAKAGMRAIAFDWVMKS